MLNRLALRICVVQALIGHTFAGDAVKDSLITAVDTEIPAETKPFIAVYTDDQSADGLTLVIETGVTASMAVTNEAGQDVIVAGVPPTDAGIEMMLDAIERQIHVALSDPDNSWAELYRLLFTGRAAPASKRGAASKDGERYAGRQIEIVGKPLADPTFGAPVNATGFWFKMLAAIDASADLAEHGDFFRDLIGDGVGRPEWRLQQRAIEATQAEATALGFALPADVDDNATIGGVDTDAQPSPP